jgi:hypothetical protein
MPKQTVVPTCRSSASGVVRRVYDHDEVPALVTEAVVEKADALLADYEEQKASVKNPKIQTVDVYHVMCGNSTMGYTPTIVVCDEQSLRHTVDTVLNETLDPKSPIYGGMVYIRKSSMNRTVV